MITVGLTGGIGSGKSEVARLLAAHGAVVVDADALAREAVAPGTPGLAAVVAEFGPEVLAADGSLDRAALGRVVFGDDTRLAALEAIVHPYVGRRSAELMAAAAPGSVVVYDVPLLVEKGLQDGYDVVVVVDAADDVRLHRLVDRRGMPVDGRPGPDGDPGVAGRAAGGGRRGGRQRRRSRRAGRAGGRALGGARGPGRVGLTGGCRTPVVR